MDGTDSNDNDEEEEYDALDNKAPFGSRQQVRNIHVHVHVHVIVVSWFLQYEICTAHARAVCISLCYF